MEELTNDIPSTHGRLLEEGVSIINLYIYHILINDPRIVEIDVGDLDQITDRIIERYNNGCETSLEDAIYSYLDGDEEDGEGVNYKWDLY